MKCLGSAKCLLVLERKIPTQAAEKAIKFSDVIMYLC